LRNLSELTAAILVGGRGTRLRSVVDDRPKVMAEIHQRPFLTYLLDQVAAAGIRSVVLCTGYLGEQLQAFFGDSYRDLHLVYSQESIPLGTGGALRLATPLLTSDPVVVLNGDSFCEAELQAFFFWYQQQQHVKAALLLTEVVDTQRYGRVNLDAHGVVCSFDEKGSKTGVGWINAGIYLLSRHFLRTIPKEGAVSLEWEVFPHWVGHGLYGYQNRGAFLDIGTPESYALAEQFFEPKIIV
jgi:NDP-sugar pyrophosphorylase family protein